MKATFFSLAALAASAFAAPVVDSSSDIAVRQNQVGDAVKIVDGEVVDKLGVGQIVDGATGGVAPRGMDAKTLTTTLSGGVTKVKSTTKTINETLSSVNSGEMTKEEANPKIMAQVNQMHYQLTEVVTKLTDAAGIPVADADVDEVLNLVVSLVSEVLLTVNGIVKITGLTPQLTGLLHSVLGLVSNLLTLVIGLLAALLPGLVAALSPLLAALGNGLLAPLLTPIVGLLSILGARP